MTQSEMRKVVDELLKSDITSAELSRQTGISESKIRKLRLEYQTIDKTYFETIEQLYLHQKKQEEND